jgi:hypothetical protein
MRFQGIEDFDAHYAPLRVAIHDDAVSDLLAALDRAISEIEIDRVGSLVDSHAHGFVLSK